MIVADVTPSGTGTSLTLYQPGQPGSAGFTPLTPEDAMTQAKFWAIQHGRADLVPHSPLYGAQLGWGGGGGFSLFLQILVTASAVTIAALTVMNAMKDRR